MYCMHLTSTNRFSHSKNNNYQSLYACVGIVISMEAKKFAMDADTIIRIEASHFYMFNSHVETSSWFILQK